jgi:hypothetical protein
VLRYAITQHNKIGKDMNMAEYFDSADTEPFDPTCHANDAGNIVIPLSGSDSSSPESFIILTPSEALRLAKLLSEEAKACVENLQSEVLLNGI